MQILSRRVKKATGDVTRWDYETPPAMYRLLEALLYHRTGDGERVVAVRLYWSDGFAGEYVDEADVDNGVVPS